jgi:hypothetical protein
LAALAAASGCAKDDTTDEPRAYGGNVILWTDVPSFQACSADSDCHLVLGGCNCYAVSQQVTDVDEQQMTCGTNGCNSQGPVIATARVSGTCTKALDVPCTADTDCKLLTGSCQTGTVAQTCVCGAVRVSVTRADLFVGPNGTCTVNGPYAGQGTVFCDTAYSGYCRYSVPDAGGAGDAR